MAKFHPTFTEEELQREEWRPVVDYKEAFSVSNLGRMRRELAVRNSPAGRILLATPDQDGYPRICLTHPPHVKHYFFVHVLVARAFIGPCPESEEVNHKDGKKTDCRLSNLEYVTHLGNVQHATASGLVPDRQNRPRGERHKLSKLTVEAVKRIRVRLAAGEPHAQIARDEGVCRATITHVHSRRHWADID